MRRKNRKCHKIGCSNDPYLGGLCRDHHEQEQTRRRRRDEALTALHFGTIDGKLPSDQSLHDELKSLRVRWERVCLAVQTGRGTAIMPVDEADYATEWCIALAEEIVEAQRAVAKAGPLPPSLALTREWVWQRFRNLEAGLRSNGISRE